MRPPGTRRKEAGGRGEGGEVRRSRGARGLRAAGREGAGGRNRSPSASGGGRPGRTERARGEERAGRAVGGSNAQAAGDAGKARMPREGGGGKSAGKKKGGGCREKRQARFSSHLPCAGRPAAFFAAFFCGRSGEKHGGGKSERGSRSAEKVPRAEAGRGSAPGLLRLRDGLRRSASGGGGPPGVGRAGAAVTPDGAPFMRKKRLWDTVALSPGRFFMAGAGRKKAAGREGAGGRGGRGRGLLGRGDPPPAAGGENAAEDGRKTSAGRCVRGRVALFLCPGLVCRAGQGLAPEGRAAEAFPMPGLPACGGFFAADRGSPGRGGRYREGMPRSVF